MTDAISERAMRRIGTTVRSKWTLQSLIGIGGMAAVYAGSHRIGRQDALKILHREAAESREVCERFEREAHVANRFKHKGAVEIRDIDVTDDGAPFLVMELLRGETLSDRERRLGWIPPLELLGIMADVLDTLRAAHGHGVIHRDIKPSNLYITRAGETKILDYGLARVRTYYAQLTRAGLILGTTSYMPPEQAKGAPVDERADLFAVGATMFRLVSRRHVHAAEDEMDLLRKMAEEPAPPLSSVAPGASPDICLIVDRALAYDREQRYPSAGVMLDDVRAVLRGGRPPHAAELARAGGFLEPTPVLPPTVPRGSNPDISSAGSGRDPDSIKVDWSDGSK